MIKNAIQHIPTSQYAFADSEDVLTIRIRTAKDDLISCELHYADRCCKKTPIDFFTLQMSKKYSDEEFDYYEVQFKTPFQRVCYFFKLISASDWYFYYADQFRKDYADVEIENNLIEGRSEYYQFPIILRSEISHIPDWFKNAIVYNIFPDSYADAHRHISKKLKTIPLENGLSSCSRNGGTLRGIIENLDYIKAMGFNCIYLNPIFLAGEWHKYDTLNYFSIDPCFGTNETFKELVETIHKNDMRIIIDGVFNHCSWYFEKFDDVVKNGKNSKYADWFYDYEVPIIRPDNYDDIPNYVCFAYERKMPKLNTANEEVQDYFAKVCSFWIEQYDIDGWRLDVANEIDKNFWRKFRKAAEKSKKDIILIGEVWENSEVWLRGDMFDSTMNYDFRKHCRDFIALNKYDAKVFSDEMNKMMLRYPTDVMLSQLNLLDSHDVPRFYSLCHKDTNRFMLALLLLFTFPGVPSLFYGDEMLIDGIKESEYRQPMIWEEEHANLIGYIQKLINIRKNYISPYSEFTVIENKDIYHYCRKSNQYEVHILINATSGDLSIGENYIDGNNMNQVVYEYQVNAEVIHANGFCIYVKEGSN